MTLSHLRWRSLAVCLLAAVLTYVGLGHLVPPYRAQAVILLQDGYRPGASGGGAALNVAALFADVAGNNNLRMLRQVLLSDDTVRELDASLKLIDYFSANGNLYERWLADPQDPDRRLGLLDHVLRADIDDRAGLMTLSVRAHDAAYAQRLAAELVSVAQRRMNLLAQQAALDQIQFMERETRRLAEDDARQQRRLQEFQARTGLTAAEIGVTVGGNGALQVAPEMMVVWQQKLAELQVRRSSLRQFLREDAPEIQQIDAEIRAVEQQIRERRQALLPTDETRPGKPGSKAVGQARIEFANLMYEATLSKEMYLGALRLTSQVRAEASRTLKRVDTVQAPTLPLRPDRGSVVLHLLAALAVGLLAWTILGQIKRYVQAHND
jgi:capsular polysaccharide transport system permease protein